MKLSVCAEIEKYRFNIDRIIGGEVANIVLNKYGAIDYEWGIKSASTDFVRSSLFSMYFGSHLFPRGT